MLKTAEEIIQYIGNAKKQTPVKVYINCHDLPKAEGDTVWRNFFIRC